MLQYLMTWVRARKHEEGQDLAEYALLIALIAIAAVVALGLLGDEIYAVFENIKDELGNALTTT